MGLSPWGLSVLSAPWLDQGGSAREHWVLRTEGDPAVLLSLSATLGLQCATLWLMCGCARSSQSVAARQAHARTDVASNRARAPLFGKYVPNKRADCGSKLGKDVSLPPLAIQRGSSLLLLQMTVSTAGPTVLPHDKQHSLLPSGSFVQLHGQ